MLILKCPGCQRREQPAALLTIDGVMPTCNCGNEKLFPIMTTVDLCSCADPVHEGYSTPQASSCSGILVVIMMVAWQDPTTHVLMATQ
jgi:hypothetical protein